MNNATIDKHINGIDLFGQVIKAPSRGPLADRFMIPPFTVLSAREGPWQERKQKWLELGLQSEIGRDKKLLGDGQGNSKEQAAALAARYGKDIDGLEDGVGIFSSATSVFDPVLCELAYKWFCPPSGTVIDPFAGGSVRGIVAAFMGLSYWGCDLRSEQIAANEEQAARLCTDGVVRPTWVAGDSRNTLEKNGDAPMCVDFLFSCPPYYDLEIYSDEPADISNMAWSDFCAAYLDIITKACYRLQQNRFACFVVGDVRDKKTGAYRGLPGLTIEAFLYAGLHLHNEAILVTPVGTLPVRSAAAFMSSRKLGKTHQNILVFVKGDAESAARRCEKV